MVPANDYFLRVVARMESDRRINAWHVSVFTAIYYLCLKNNGCHPVPVTRKKLMALSHIRSAVTYHKCMFQLQAYGYLTYHPSYHPAGSTVIFTDFTPASDKN